MATVDILRLAIAALIFVAVIATFYAPFGAAARTPRPRARHDAGKPIAPAPAPRPSLPAFPAQRIHDLNWRARRLMLATGLTSQEMAPLVLDWMAA